MEQEQQEIGALESELAEKQAELKEHYCQLGKALLDFAESEQRHIGGMVDEIVDIRRRISKARCEVICAECLAYSPAGSACCARCGAELGRQECRDGKDG